jgi:hypothetical protein
VSQRSALLDCLMNAVVEADLDDAEEDFVAVAVAFLGLAISKLPAHKREEYLAEIEAGALRGIVAQFPGARQPPAYPTAVQ